MKISTKGRYGLRAMLDLAINSQNCHISLNSIAERQYISENYLERLVSELKKSGLVNSIRGAQGGYILSKDASEISVGDILRALEGNLAPVDCVNAEESCCEEIDTCATKFVWKKIQDSINDTVNNITLQDLVDEHNRVNSHI